MAWIHERWEQLALAHFPVPGDRARVAFTSDCSDDAERIIIDDPKTKERKLLHPSRIWLSEGDWVLVIANVRSGHWGGGEPDDLMPMSFIYSEKYHRFGWCPAYVLEVPWA